MRASHAVPEIARTNLVRFLHQHSSRIGGKLTTKSDTAGHCDKIRCFCNKLATLGFFWRHTGDKTRYFWRENRILRCPHELTHEGGPWLLPRLLHSFPCIFRNTVHVTTGAFEAAVGHRSGSPWAANPAVDVGPSFCRRVPRLGAPAAAPDPTRSCASFSHMHPFPGKGGHALSSVPRVAPALGPRHTRSRRSPSGGLGRAAATSM